VVKRQLVKHHMRPGRAGARLVGADGVEAGLEGVVHAVLALAVGALLALLGRHPQALHQARPREGAHVGHLRDLERERETERWRGRERERAREGGRERERGGMEGGRERIRTGLVQSRPSAAAHAQAWTAAGPGSGPHLFGHDVPGPGERLLRRRRLPRPTREARRHAQRRRARGRGAAEEHVGEGLQAQGAGRGGAGLALGLEGQV
jgi:hypothetical protein